MITQNRTQKNILNKQETQGPQKYSSLNLKFFCDYTNLGREKYSKKQVPQGPQKLKKIT